MFTAFLPLKYKSERVDNKNFRIIDDKPLFFYILETISSIELIDEIVIDFDNKSVVENVEKLFKNITFVKRGKNLLDPYESVNNLIKDITLLLILVQILFYILILVRLKN